MLAVNCQYNLTAKVNEHTFTILLAAFIVGKLVTGQHEHDAHGRLKINLTRAVPAIDE